MSRPLHSHRAQNRFKPGEPLRETTPFSGPESKTTLFARNFWQTLYILDFACRLLLNTISSRREFPRANLTLFVPSSIQTSDARLCNPDSYSQGRAWDTANVYADRNR